MKARLLLGVSLGICSLVAPAALLAGGKPVSCGSQQPLVQGPHVTWHWQKIKNQDFLQERESEFSQNRRQR
jgi:hypothetical protein